MLATVTTIVTNLVTSRYPTSCRVIESQHGCNPTAEVTAPRGFVLLRVAASVTKTHSPRRASLGMVRAMITTAPLARALMLRCVPCGFRSEISAWRRTARTWHVARMRQAIPTIHDPYCNVTMIGSRARDERRDGAAVIISERRRRETDSGEAESC